MRCKGLYWSILFTVTMLITSLFSTTAYGFYYDNPAEEAFSTTKFELVIPQISLEAKNNLFTLENLNIDLTDPAAKEQFFNRMAGGTFRADFHSQLNTGLTIGRSLSICVPGPAGPYGWHQESRSLSLSVSLQTTMEPLKRMTWREQKLTASPVSL